MEPREISGFDRSVVKVKKTIDGMYDFFASITNLHREMDIEEAAAFYTKDIDAFIRASEKNSGNTYVAGQLILQYVNAELFLLLLDLYFQDAGGKWVKQRSQVTRQLKYLKPAAAQELREKKEISFEIDPPEETPEGTVTGKPAAQHSSAEVGEVAAPAKTASPVAQSAPAVTAEVAAASADPAAPVALASAQESAVVPPVGEDAQPAPASTDEAK